MAHRGAGRQPGLSPALLLRSGGAEAGDRRVGNEGGRMEGGRGGVRGSVVLAAAVMSVWSFPTQTINRKRAGKQ